jgi:TRAP-type C4-dicarboxylate transport system permease small subunit
VNNKDEPGRVERRSSYHRLLEGMAALAAMFLALAVMLITADVVMRTVGLQPSAHTLAVTEYGLFYATMFGAPWLLRTHGHVHVEIVQSAVPGPVRNWMVKAVCLLGLVSCLVIAWVSAGVAIENFTRGAFDMRSFDMPRWLLFAPMPISFLMMAWEFFLFLIGRGHVYGESPDLAGHA